MTRKSKKLTVTIEMTVGYNPDNTTNLEDRVKSCISDLLNEHDEQEIEPELQQYTISVKEITSK